MKLHLVMQPKGGAGKSFSAVHLIQYLEDQGREVDAYDLDSANNTLSQFEALKADPVDVASDANDRKIDERKFDLLLESFTNSKGSDIVVDIGASIVQPFNNHLADLDFFAMAADLNLELIVHVPVSGGQGLIDNMQGLAAVYRFIEDNAQYVIWANPYFGELDSSGIKLEDSKLVKSMKKNILGIVTIPEWDSDPIKDDVKKMMTAKLTYKEIETSNDFPLFSKARLKRIKERFFSRINLSQI